MTDTELTFVALGLAALAVLAAWAVGLLLARLWRAAASHLPATLGRVAEQRHLARVRDGARDRFPVTYRFLADRLRTDRFTGLPLTLVVAAAAYLAALLGGLVEELLEADEIGAVDAAINDAFASYRVSPLIEIVRWFTNLGDSAAVTAVAFVVTGFLWVFGGRRIILPLWVTVLGAILSTWAGKFAFDRPRPDFVTGVTALSASFPSAHATGAIAVYGFIAYVIARGLRSGRARFEILFWSGALIAVIALSRMFLSVHFASDVAAGLLVGGFWLLAGIALTELRRRGEPWAPRPGAD
ncbi:MAG: phosphatase PAP2 family protein [Alphaproteobacteria bacterium]